MVYYNTLFENLNLNETGKSTDQFKPYSLIT